MRRKYRVPGPQTLQDMIGYYSDPAVCIQELVEARWPNGVACPHCGCVEVKYMSSRPKWQCNGCRKQFTAKFGTIFEESKLPLNKWFVAIWLIAATKNGTSSCELARHIGVTQKTAWYMLHRIREAMRNGNPEAQFFGSIEADETYIGGLESNKHEHKKLKSGRGTVGKTPVFALIERGREKGKSRVSAKVIHEVNSKTVHQEIMDAVMRGSYLYTDDSRVYKGIKGELIHQWVNHAVRYAEGLVHTNGCENFFALLKRSLKGTYIAVMPFHLIRYVEEQAFRFNERNDSDRGRFCNILRAVAGKRLTYGKLTSAFQEYFDQIFGPAPTTT